MAHILVFHFQISGEPKQQKVSIPHGLEMSCMIAKDLALNLWSILQI